MTGAGRKDAGAAPSGPPPARPAGDAGWDAGWDAGLSRRRRAVTDAGGLGGGRGQDPRALMELAPKGSD